MFILCCIWVDDNGSFGRLWIWGVSWLCKGFRCRCKWLQGCKQCQGFRGSRLCGDGVVTSMSSGDDVDVQAAHCLWACGCSLVFWSLWCSHCGWGGGWAVYLLSEVLDVAVLMLFFQSFNLGFHSTLNCYSSLISAISISKRLALQDPRHWHCCSGCLRGVRRRGDDFGFSAATGVTGEAVDFSLSARILNLGKSLSNWLQSPESSPFHCYKNWC